MLILSQTPVLSVSHGASNADVINFSATSEKTTFSSVQLLDAHTFVVDGVTIEYLVDTHELLLSFTVGQSFFLSGYLTFFLGIL